MKIDINYFFVENFAPFENFNFFKGGYYFKNLLINKYKDDNFVILPISQ